MYSDAGSKSSHPVQIECPVCQQRIRVPLHSLSAGARFSCRDCQHDIPIATPVLRQLLSEIDKDLRTTDDLPIVLRPERTIVTSTDEKDISEKSDAPMRRR